MSHKQLAEIVVHSIEYFELADDAQLDPDTAVQFLENIAANMNAATAEERSAVKDAAKARLEWFLQEPDQYGHSPRKTLSAKHRRLLESIASGEAFGWTLGGET